MIAHIHTLVAEHFLSAGVDARVVYGWTEHGKQINQGPRGANRVVFRPGDDGGKAGQIGPPIRTTTAPRTLATWSTYLDVFVWASDPNLPGDEAAQVGATVCLFEELFRAVHTLYSGYYRFGDPRWVVSPTEYAFGRELRVGLTLHIPIRDAANPQATPTPALTAVVIPPP